MRLDDGRVVPAFVAQALRGEDFTVFGDGTQTRSFCYVRTSWTGWCGWRCRTCTEPVNLGNPREMTILQFAEAVRAAAGGGGRIVFQPLPKDDPKQRRRTSPGPGSCWAGSRVSRWRRGSRRRWRTSARCSGLAARIRAGNSPRPRRCERQRAGAGHGHIESTRHRGQDPLRAGPGPFRPTGHRPPSLSPEPMSPRPTESPRPASSPACAAGTPPPLPRDRWRRCHCPP